MARINLLPWREELRKEKTNQFLVSMGLSVILTFAIVAFVHINISRVIDFQNSRNTILEGEIQRLDIELLKIKDLEETKAKLLSRMEIIQSLQHQRPQIVHLFDEMVRTIPEGLHLKEIVQKGDTITILGVAESNGRVSAYMRNLDASEWMKSPKLRVIESKRKDGRGSEFTLVVSQATPKETPEEGL